MKVFSFTATGEDGNQHGVRLLHTDEEIKGLQAAGLIPDVSEIVHMQVIADRIVAEFEREALTARGGRIQ